MNYQSLIKTLLKNGVLKSKRVVEAFLACDRKNFVPEEHQAKAYIDAPLPIKSGQTISQPYTVAFMIELLAPREGNKILDIGSGSGWTTAILAYLAGDRGLVYGLEVNREVYEFGLGNLRRHALHSNNAPHPGLPGNITLVLGSGWQGLAEHAPYDRILVSAAAFEAPPALKDQLAEGGRMVVPVGETFSSTIKCLEKIEADKFREENYPGFAFVPLTGNHE